MQLIDTHSHLDTHHFAHDFQDVLTRSRKKGVIAQILPGVRRAWWPHLLELCRTEKGLYGAPGLHPLYLNHHKLEDLELLAALAASGQIIAIGEIGLDYYHKGSPQKAQTDLFVAQLGIAEKHHLPVLLHVRKAHDQVQSILRRKRFSFGGIVHAFSGSLQQAEHYIKLGFKIAIGGTITYDRATRIRTVAQKLPLEAIVLETDAPDIPPAPYHGERNSPEYLPIILESLARLRSETAIQLAAATTANVSSLFCLNEQIDKECSHVTDNAPSAP